MSIDTLPALEQNQIASLLLSKLQAQKTPMGFQELESRFSSQGLMSSRLLREAVWKLVEEGKIRFNANWDLEAVEAIFISS